MSDKFCILLTASSCGHCQHYRGDVILNSNQAYMHPEFLMKIIAPYKDIRLSLLNVHYKTMHGNLTNIQDITKTYLSPKKNAIIQERFSNNDKNNATVEVRVFDNDTKILTLTTPNKEVLKSDVQITWFDFVRDKISPKLENYTFFFPCFAMVYKNNWKDSIVGGAQLIAYLNSGYTIKTESGEIMFDKNDPDWQKRQENVFQMIDNYVVKKVEMKPHKDLSTTDIKKVEKVKEVKNKKEVKEVKEIKKVSFENVVQIRYDD